MPACAQPRLCADGAGEGLSRRGAAKAPLSCLAGRVGPSEGSAPLLHQGTPEAGCGSCPLGLLDWEARWPFLDLEQSLASKGFWVQPGESSCLWGGSGRSQVGRSSSAPFCSSPASLLCRKSFRTPSLPETVGRVGLFPDLLMKGGVCGCGGGQRKPFPWARLRFFWVM